MGLDRVGARKFQALWPVGGQAALRLGRRRVKQNPPAAGLIGEACGHELTFDEAHLVERARRGDAAAFEALVREHGPMVYNLALRTLGDPQAAEDLAQEAFVRAWRGLDGFRDEARFGTWLYRIVTNLCYNRLPRLRRQLAELDPDEAAGLPDEGQRVDARLLDDELRRRLHAEIKALPEAYRLLVTLRHLQGMSYAEIAEATAMPLGTVKTGIHRARNRLRQALEDPAAHG